tara:strand:- start:1740 stop:2243 length:504 start_codon:yes stop_codon:yes gene_type:complete
MIRSVSTKNKQDIEALAIIYNHYITHSVISFEVEAVSTSEMTDRVKRVQSLDFPWLVAEDNNQVIGFAYASPWHSRCAYRHTVELTVYVSPQHTGQGWGLQLHEALITKLNALKVHVMIAAIALPNPASVALHEKLGFKKVAQFDEVGYKFGKWVDVGYWQYLVKQQ